MSDYPKALVEVDHVEPVPRRVRGLVSGRTVLDTTRARYVWEWPPYPQYYVPLDDVASDLLVDEGNVQQTRRGPAHLHSVRTREGLRAGAAKVYRESPIDGVAGTVRIEWDALDAWFEEEERVFVHPRNPYTRVDALRSSRHVRVQLDGVLLAESTAPVLVFETALPTRYYLDRSAIRWEHLRASDTVTRCPYKGVTSGYWSAVVGDEVHPDLAWAYDFPTAPLLPIAGLVAFFNERVDLEVDGERLARPMTHFS